MVTGQQPHVFRTLTAAVGVLGCVSLVSMTPAARVAAQAAQEVACLAIMPPVVEGFEPPATQAADAARDLFVGMLAGPSTPVVPLEARLTARATAEARDTRCTQILVTKLVRKRAGEGDCSAASSDRPAAPPPGRFRASPRVPS